MRTSTIPPKGSIPPSVKSKSILQPRRTDNITYYDQYGKDSSAITDNYGASYKEMRHGRQGGGHELTRRKWYEGLKESK